VDKDKYKGVDRNKILAELREKYEDMPEPGTQEWSGFLTRLKEESPDDYRKALLLGGGVTTALQKEIQRSKRRDAVQGFLNRLFFRQHQGKNVPDKRKIGLLIFVVVGGLFMLAFFVGTSPKKEATGGGLISGVPTAGQVGKNGEPSTVSASPSSGTKASGSEAGTGSSAGSSDSPPLASILSSASSSTGSSASAASSTSPTGDASSSPTPPVPAQNVPPPPPPVYGTGSPVPPPPDTSYSAGNQPGQAGVVYPPPMVLYADPGMPVGPTPNPSTANTAPSTPPPSEPTNTSEPRGGMLFITNQPSSMMIVSGQAQSGMAVSEPGPAQADPFPSTPQSPYPPGAPMPFPNTPGGGQP